MTAWGHVANLLGVPATIVAAVLVALPVAVTGGIHLAKMGSATPPMRLQAGPRASESSRSCTTRGRAPSGSSVLSCTLFCSFPCSPRCRLRRGRSSRFCARSCSPARFRGSPLNAGRPRGRTAWPRGSRLRRSARRSSCRFALSLRLRLQGMVACASGRRRPYGGGGAFGARVVPPCCPGPLRRGDGGFGRMVSAMGRARDARRAGGGARSYDARGRWRALGKRTFVREKLGFAADDFVDAAQLAEGGVPAAFAGRVRVPREELERALDADWALERLIGFDAVILPLVGSGVVPTCGRRPMARARGRRGCGARCALMSSCA